MRKVTFAKGDRSFHAMLKVRVNQYFDDNGISRHANAAMVWKTLFWLGAFFSVWGVFVSGILPVAVAVPFFMLGGFTMVGCGFNIGHDAVHGAYSSKPWVNRLLSLTFDGFGASAYTWSIAHNWLHHTYTNVPDVDSDLDPGPWMRFSPGKKLYWFHRYQHLFAWPLYSLTSLVWTFKKDWLQIAERDPRTGKRAAPRHVALMLLGKAFHFGLFLVVPLLLSPYPALAVVAAYVGAHLVTGLSLAVVFQLAHCVEGPAYPEPSEEGVLGESWAEHQLRTTANFSVGSKLMTFLVGGLNHQVEHHLFSGICHIHYPALAPIVKRTAEEHGLPYHDSGSFFAAVASHYRTMKRHGRPVVVEERIDERLPLAA